jgi:hypothetical protein
MIFKLCAVAFHHRMKFISQCLTLLFIGLSCSDCHLLHISWNKSKFNRVVKSKFSSKRKRSIEVRKCRWSKFSNDIYDITFNWSNGLNGNIKTIMIITLLGIQFCFALFYKKNFFCSDDYNAIVVWLCFISCCQKKNFLSFSWVIAFILNFSYYWLNNNFVTSLILLDWSSISSIYIYKYDRNRLFIAFHDIDTAKKYVLIWKKKLLSFKILVSFFFQRKLKMVTRFIYIYIYLVVRFILSQTM